VPVVEEAGLSHPVPGKKRLYIVWPEGGKSAQMSGRASSLRLRPRPVAGWDLYGGPVGEEHGTTGQEAGARCALHALNASHLLTLLESSLGTGMSQC